MAGRQGDRQWYSREDIARCMRRVVGVDLNQAVQVRGWCVVVMMVVVMVEVLHTRT